MKGPAWHLFVKSMVINLSLRSNNKRSGIIALKWVWAGYLFCNLTQVASLVGHWTPRELAPPEGGADWSVSVTPPPSNAGICSSGDWELKVGWENMECAEEFVWRYESITETIKLLTNGW